MIDDHISPDGEAFFDLINTYLSPDERKQVQEAFALARREHGDVRRASGELYFTHPLTIAYYLAEYQLDAPALIAALLHDVVEDADVSLKEIELQFGEDVRRLVDGLTKFDAVTGSTVVRSLSKEEARTATLHKLLAIMTDDVRVGIIKIFDRLHNMRTIEAKQRPSQVRSASETLAVYAPLANRLGMWNVKNDLETLSLRVLDGEAYQFISRRLDQLRREHQEEFGALSREIATHLTDAGIKIVDMSLAPENIYSVYRSSQANGQVGSQFRFDPTLRLVVVLNDTSDCYLALGELHQLWRPVPGTFDDYIAAPRDNLYRSLHTTVLHSSGRRVKIRLRTLPMNVISDIGVLARWIRIGMPLWSRETARRVEVLFENIRDTISREPYDLDVGVQSVVEDVFHDQIVVYTPAGDMKELPEGATPLDFAYMIHSEVGAQCHMALVNGQFVALNSELEDGDHVEIIKRGNAPQRIWLDEDLGYLFTTRARNGVRRWFRRLPRAVAEAEGQQLLQQELEMLGLQHIAYDRIARLMGMQSEPDLFAALGHADILPTAVATAVLEDTWHEGPLREVGTVIFDKNGQKLIVINAAGRQLRMCGICQPQPSDSIIGFARQESQVTIHREGCSRLPTDPFSARTLKLNWGTEESCEVRLFTVEILVHDRAGLLFEISELVQSEGINMPSVRADTQDGKARLILEMEVTAPRRLVRFLHRVLALVNVYSVTRLPSETTPA